MSAYSMQIAPHCHSWAANPKRCCTREEGNVLRCIQAAEAPGGCSTGEGCRDCVVRNSVSKAMTGHEMVRQRADMELVTKDGNAKLHLLVTATPFEYEGLRHVLLILEDITELAELRKIFPICSNCKKIRNDDKYWEDVDQYLMTHTHIQFTHSVCPDCARVLYPLVFDRKEGS